MSVGTKRTRPEAEDYNHSGKKQKTKKNGDAKESTPVKKPKREEKEMKLAQGGPADGLQPKKQSEAPEASEAAAETEPAPVSEKSEKKKQKKDKKKDKKDKKNKDKAAETEASTEKPAAEPAQEAAQAPEVVMEDVLETAAESTEPVSEKAKKKEKKDKKKSKKSENQEAEQPTAQADVAMEDTPAAEAKPASEKPEKKEKKSKKDKKDKKKSKSDEATPESDVKGVSNGDEAVASGATTNSAASSPANRNGSTYSYKQTAVLDAVPESEIQSFLKTAEIHISDPLAVNFRPVIQFSQLPPSKLIAKKPFEGFKTPTPIQSASWPYALSGRDVIGIAETGSGKTFAFSVPCVEALASVPKPNRKGHSTHARAVIVSPTRELAMQTHAAISGLASLVNLSAVCLYGGASKDDQRALLRKNSGADIIVATPGRLKDFLSDDTVSLSEVMFAVLDEADRMLDKGFEDDIKQILGSCPPREKRQTLMFTATWPTSVRGLADGYMVDPVKVTIGTRTRAGEEGEGNGSTELQANSRIAQTVEVVDPRGKEQRLLEILREAQKGTAKNDRILVFCLYKKEAVRVEGFLQKRGLRVCSIHGDLGQDQRTRSLEAFKAGTTSVLVATDVAARGLDIPEVKLVVNVTFPLTIEDYVHRIGRTGRAGKQGKAITLFTEHDKAHSGSLVNILKGANQPVPEELLKFGTTVKKKAHDSYGAFFKDVDMSKKGTKITFD